MWKDIDLIIMKVLLILLMVVCFIGFIISLYIYPPSLAIFFVIYMFFFNPFD
jgi:hypothetical protein